VCVLDAMCPGHAATGKVASLSVRSTILDCRSMQGALSMTAGRTSAEKAATLDSARMTVCMRVYGQLSTAKLYHTKHVELASNRDKPQRFEASACIRNTTLRTTLVPSTHRTHITGTSLSV
jgi:hypothetical protein